MKTLGFTIIAGKYFTLSDIKLTDPQIHGDNIQYTYMVNEADSMFAGIKNGSSNPVHNLKTQ